MVTKLQCGHEFHNHCVKDYIILKGMDCPTCPLKITAKKLVDRVGEGILKARLKELDSERKRAVLKNAGYLWLVFNNY